VISSAVTRLADSSTSAVVSPNMRMAIFSPLLNSIHYGYLINYIVFL
jgi:hypothetical protein